MTIRANQVGADQLTEATAGIGISKDEALVLSWLTTFPGDAVAAVASVIRKARGAYIAPGEPPMVVVREKWPHIVVESTGDPEDAVEVCSRVVTFYDYALSPADARSLAAALIRAADLLDAGCGRVLIIDGTWWCGTAGEPCAPISATSPCPVHGTVPPAGPGFRFDLNDLGGDAKPSSEASHAPASPPNTIAIPTFADPDRVYTPPARKGDDQ